MLLREIHGVLKPGGLLVLEQQLEQEHWRQLALQQAQELELEPWWWLENRLQCRQNA